MMRVVLQLTGPDFRTGGLSRHGLHPPPAAILAADVAAFHSRIDADLDDPLRALQAIRRDLLDPTIAAHNGRLLGESGDLLLVEFINVLEALNCAILLKRTVADHNRNLPTGKRIEFRIGIHREVWSFGMAASSVRE
jgi:class 3 adenylate cyclase